MKSVDYQNIVYSFAIISKRINCQNIDMVIILVDITRGSAKAGQMVTYWFFVEFIQDGGNKDICENLTISFAQQQAQISI